MENYRLFNVQRIKVAIVEDHRMVAEGFERLVNESDIAQVAGIAFSAAGCMTLLAQTEVDVLLLDVRLPDGNGIELCPRIKTKYPDLKILILTIHSEINKIRLALKSGASGYLLKNAPADQIMEGIRTVASGKQFLCDEAYEILEQNEGNILMLSRREKELAKLIIDGLQNVEIADKMCLGVHTIKSYRKKLFLKLKVHDTTQLKQIVIEQHLI